MLLLEILNIVLLKYKKENCSLKYEIELKDNEIGNLKSEISTKGN